jgi:hypothetical protein
MNEETEPAAEPASAPSESSEPSSPPQPEAPKPGKGSGRSGRSGRSLTLAGLALGAAVAFGGYQLWRHPSQGAAKSAIPASTFLAISLDMKALRGAEWFRRLTDNDAGRLVGLANMKALCDYDATAFVDAIDVAIPEKGDHGDFGVVMRANDHPLDDKALVACATKLASMHGASGKENVAPVIEDRDGYSMLQEDGVARFAMRPGGPYLTGRGTWLETMVDSAAGKIPSLDANPEHASLRAAATKRLPGTSPAAIVVSALLPPEVRAQVRAEVMGETDPSSVAAMNGVLGVSGVGLALGTRGPQPLLPDGKVDITAELVDIVVELHCESPQACTDVAGLIERKRDHFAADFRVRVLGLDSAIESLEVHADGAAVHVYGHLNPERVVKALGRFGIGAHGPGGGGGGAPPGAGVMGRGTAGTGANGGKGFAGDYPTTSPYDPAPAASATAPPATLPPALTPSAHH